MGLNAGGECGEEICAQRGPITRGAVERFGNLIEVPPNGEQLLIGASEGVTLRGQEGGLLGQERAQHGDNPGARVRALGLRAGHQRGMLGGGQAKLHPFRHSFGAMGDGGANHSTTLPHRAERVTKRMELRLTPSEHAALVARAKAEGSHPSTWVVAMVRTLLTQQPTLLPPERDALARSNQQLLAIGRNLNQIAKALNSSPRDRTALRADLLTALSTRIQTHTSLVSDVLRRTLERWQIR